MLFVLQLIHIRLVNAKLDPVCGDIYGKPLVPACSEAIYALEYTMDRRDHFFALPSVTIRPAGVSKYQWNNRVALPMLEHGQAPARCKQPVGQVSRDVPTTDHSLLLPVQPSQCIVGIFPIKRLDGTITSDTGRYLTMGNDSRDVEGKCLFGLGYGGHVNTGMFSVRSVCATKQSSWCSSHAQAGQNGRLGLVMYEPGSGWDLSVKDAQAAGEDIYLEEDASAVNLVVPFTVANRTGRITGSNAPLIGVS